MTLEARRQRDTEARQERALLDMQQAVIGAIVARHPDAVDAASDAVCEAIAQLVKDRGYLAGPVEVRKRLFVRADCRMIDTARLAESRKRDPVAIDENAQALLLSVRVGDRGRRQARNRRGCRRDHPLARDSRQRGRLALSSRPTRCAQQFLTRRAAVGGCRTTVDRQWPAACRPLPDAGRPRVGRSPGTGIPSSQFDTRAGHAASNRDRRGGSWAGSHHGLRTRLVALRVASVVMSRDAN